MITVDTREQHPFSGFWDESVFTIATLKTGDYSNGTTVIERKTIPDLCNSLGKGKKRFYREVKRGFDYLIIEGNISDINPHLINVNSNMTPQYIMHCLKEIHDEHGIQVIFGTTEYCANLTLSILGK